MFVYNIFTDCLTDWIIIHHCAGDGIAQKIIKNNMHFKIHSWRGGTKIDTANASGEAHVPWFSLHAIPPATIVVHPLRLPPVAKKVAKNVMCISNRGSHQRLYPLNMGLHPHQITIPSPPNPLAHLYAPAQLPRWIACTFVYVLWKGARNWKNEG